MMRSNTLRVGDLVKSKYTNQGFGVVTEVDIDVFLRTCDCKVLWSDGQSFIAESRSLIRIYEDKK